MAYIDKEKAVKKLRYVYKTYGVSNVIQEKIKNALDNSTADVAPKSETELIPCYMCNNARLNDELDDDNDFGSFTIGNSVERYRIMLSTGWGKPLRIEVHKWVGKVGRWCTVAIYYPKYCPNCGREIKEYEEAAE